MSIIYFFWLLKRTDIILALYCFNFALFKYFYIRTIIITNVREGEKNYNNKYLNILPYPLDFSAIISNIIIHTNDTTIKYTKNRNAKPNRTQFSCIFYWNTIKQQEQVTTLEIAITIIHCYKCYKLRVKSSTLL